MSTLPGNPTALKTKVEGLITSANSIQSAIDGLSKFVTTSNSLAVAATYGQVKNAKKDGARRLPQASRRSGGPRRDRQATAQRRPGIREKDQASA